MKQLNPNVEKLLNLGKDTINNIDYKELGFTSDDTQELVDIIMNDELHFSNKNKNYPYAPIHAIYTLAKLEIEEPFDRVSKLVKIYNDDYLANAIVDYAKDLNCLSKINTIQDFHNALNRKAKEEIAIPEPVTNEELKIEEDVVTPEAVIEELITEEIDDIKKEEKQEVIVIEGNELIKEAINEMHEKDNNSNKPIKKGRPPVKKPVKHIKVGRNEPCPCGSGKKYKKCCLHSS